MHRPPGTVTVSTSPVESPRTGQTVHLKKSLGPVTLWGLGVGYVISGEYFGWNQGLPLGGTYGLLLAFALVTLMYVTFVFSYAEMACAIPRAGGVFVYGVRGLGLAGGYLGGVAQVIEFVFAPPAIAMAIGAYVSTWWPGIEPRWAALTAYLLFTCLNVWGVRQAASFELLVTVLAVGELLVFTAVTAPHFDMARFTANAWPAGYSGALASIPFAIWFYLAIEGVANVAEEARNPRRDVALGFGSALATLVILAVCVLVCAVGVGGWERIVYLPGDLTMRADGAIVVAQGAALSDSPLPLALGQLFSPAHPMFHLLVAVGVLGLVASLSGIILIAGRALFELGRVGFLPYVFGQASPRTHTPAGALWLNFAIGALSIMFLDTGRLITMSALGAVTLYVVSMLALLRLRRIEPELPRPFRAPLYPVFPLIALATSLGALAAMAILNYNPADRAGSVTVWYLGALAGAMLYYGLVIRRRLTADDLAHFYRIQTAQTAVPNAVADNREP